MTYRTTQASHGLLSLALASRGLAPTRISDDSDGDAPVRGLWMRLTITAALLVGLAIPMLTQTPVA